MVDGKLLRFNEKDGYLEWNADRDPDFLATGLTGWQSHPADYYREGCVTPPMEQGEYC